MKRYSRYFPLRTEKHKQHNDIGFSPIYTSEKKLMILEIDDPYPLSHDYNLL